MDNKGKMLYLECCSGISGDMTVAALLDLGADESVLGKVLESLPVQGFKTKISRVKKAGLDVCDFDVILDEAHENHDHDMAYLHGDGHIHDHEHHHHGHEHEHDHHHDHEHDHDPEHGHRHDHDHSHDYSHMHTHEHRGLPEILHIIDHAEMSVRAKETAKRIFQVLAKAEAKAHGVPETEVHFHEVGAVDSIVDIIAAAVCLDNLNITGCVVPVLYEGSGTVRCQHGILPVPVPAVANIVSDYGLNLRITKLQGELVTPTGAAIAAAVRTAEELPERFRIKRIGMGAGKRKYERPSILRAMLIETPKEQELDVIWKLESNMDDCTGEALGHVMGKLMEAGARDVNYMPLYMKKNRPGYQLNVICTEEKIREMEYIIFSETTTIGIRRQKMQRTILERNTRTVETSLGTVCIKECELPAANEEGNGKKMIRLYPEYESVAELCRNTKMAFPDVYRLIERECNE